MMNISGVIGVVMLALLGTAVSQGGTQGASFPLSFEPNVGQTNPEVKFISRSPGFSLFLTPAGATLAFPSSSLIRLKFPGGNSHSIIEGIDELPGRHSLVGLASYLRNVHIETIRSFLRSQPD